ncbi:MAG: glutamate 5-kinase [Alphaproteobacteria bacterium]|nr:glutamate 5-kinase [Alphaproteobacteria bacterium]
MQDRQRVVVKIGSSLLANAEHLTLRYAFMHGVMEDIARMREDGVDVVLTSSGSVAIGLSTIGKTPETAGLLDKQAAAACGQPLLMHAYKQIAQEYGFDIAQVLVTLEDLEDRRRFLNVKNTISRLLEHGILPIVNENDSVTTQEIKVGDNDRLAAKVAQMIQADEFVMLTSIDGLYDRNPDDPDAQHVPEVSDVSEYLEVTSQVSELGSGGMLTKMRAANMAQNAGVTTRIGEGLVDRPITAILSGERRHTRCVAIGDPDSSWRIWLTDRLVQVGGLVVGPDAAERLSAGRTAIGREDIVSVQGEFTKGDVLHIFDEAGEELARGMSNFTAAETLLLCRNPDQSPFDLLGYSAAARIISAENMAILKDHHLPWDAPEDDVIMVE